jgi:hypothetical protein
VNCGNITPASALVFFFESIYSSAGCFQAIKGFSLFRLFYSAVFLLACSCGSLDGSEWLVKTSASEISVADAGEIWITLDPDLKARFVAGGNPVGDFISYLGRNEMIMNEIAGERYLYSPLIESMKECFVRNASVSAFRDSMVTAARADITDADLLIYRDLLGSVVWYSSSTGISEGPVRLPDLPWELALAFDSMSAGFSIEIQNTVYTLDSIATTAQYSTDETAQHSDIDGNTGIDNVDTFALFNLAESRVSRQINALGDQVAGTFLIDTSAVTTYCSRRDSLNGSEILLSWNGGSITAESLDGILAFLSTGGQHDGPVSAEWLCRTLRNQARLFYITELYSIQYPESFAEIENLADEFAIDQASELLFTENVTDIVVITDSMAVAAYSSMDSIPMVRETRTFASVIVPPVALGNARMLAGNGDALLEAGYPGFSEYLATGSEFLSRPVTAAELPAGLCDSLFSLGREDSIWHGPVEISGDMFVFFKLDEVFPPCQASFDQLEQSIRHRLLIHLEEQITMDWICRLEITHNLRINRDILKDLPADPAAWKEL